MKNTLAVTIIALNEEAHIKQAIASAKLVTSEVIVVDGGSTDNTIKIAQKAGATIYQRPFDDFSRQKNFAASKADSMWIFSLDADERVTPELASEIKSKIKHTTTHGFLVPRRNFILGGEIKHSRWSPDKHIWLWQREFGEWVGEVHEEVVVNGIVDSLKNAKLHYQDKTVTEFIESLNRYTQIEAKRIVESGRKFQIVRFMFDPIKSFLGRYIYKQGFRDGWRGFVLCSLRAMYYGIVWLKVLELQNK